MMTEPSAEAHEEQLSRLKTLKSSMNNNLLTFADAL